jgi:hypothetical protein
MIRIRNLIPMRKTYHRGPKTYYTGSKKINPYQWKNLATHALKFATEALNILFSVYLYDSCLN